MDAPAITVTDRHLAELVDAELPPSEWVEVTRDQLERFDASTYDGPSTNYGGASVARSVHGTYSLSLVVPLWERTVGVTGAGGMVLYGVDRVRFPAPVWVGRRVRGLFRIVETTRSGNGLRYRLAATLEVEGEDKPGVVAELVFWVPV
ncbi:MAG: hypothetical protein M3P44_17690 [Actinomycetota bacterium]|nr:hypothetical protein [Actinomycetota bacterium]